MNKRWGLCHPIQELSSLPLALWRGGWGVRLLLVFLLASCSSDDSYHYPSVKLDFLTAHTGADKQIATVITDDGETMNVLHDGANLTLPADTTLRIVCNYEPMTDGDGRTGVRLYSALKPVSPFPLPASEFEEGLKHDPADVLSCWMGRNYLNLILTVKAMGGKHVFHFIEDEVSADATLHEKHVYLTLYHDAGKDTTGYTQRVYLSVPLQPYTEPGMMLKVHFSVHTESGEIKTLTETL